jgi:hypothetical protein
MAGGGKKYRRLSIMADCSSEVLGSVYVVRRSYGRLLAVWWNDWTRKSDNLDYIVVENCIL